jgi:hypothetical protein
VFVFRPCFQEVIEQFDIFREEAERYEMVE